MSRPPPEETEGFEQPKKVSESADALFPELNQEPEVNPEFAKNIKFSKDMDNPNWMDYVNEATFPDYKDGYDKDLFFDELDKEDLNKQTELVRELEIDRRFKRRETLQERYKEALRRWKNIHGIQDPAAEELVRTLRQNVKVLILIGSSLTTVPMSTKVFTANNYSDYSVAFLIRRLFHTVYDISYDNIEVQSPINTEENLELLSNTIYAQIDNKNYSLESKDFVKCMTPLFHEKSLKTTEDSILYVFLIDHGEVFFFGESQPIGYQALMDYLNKFAYKRRYIFNDSCKSGSLITFFKNCEQFKNRLVSLGITDEEVIQRLFIAFTFSHKYDVLKYEDLKAVFSPASHANPEVVRLFGGFSFHLANFVQKMKDSSFVITPITFITDAFLDALSKVENSFLSLRHLTVDMADVFFLPSFEPVEKVFENTMVICSSGPRNSSFSYADQYYNSDDHFYAAGFGTFASTAFIKELFLNPRENGIDVLRINSYIRQYPNLFIMAKESFIEGKKDQFINSKLYGIVKNNEDKIKYFVSTQEKAAEQFFDEGAMSWCGPKFDQFNISQLKLDPDSHEVPLLEGEYSYPSYEEMPSFSSSTERGIDPSKNPPEYEHKGEAPTELTDELIAKIREGYGLRTLKDAYRGAKACTDILCEFNIRLLQNGLQPYRDFVNGPPTPIPWCACEYSLMRREACKFFKFLGIPNLTDLKGEFCYCYQINEGREQEVTKIFLSTLKYMLNWYPCYAVIGGELPPD